MSDIVTGYTYDCVSYCPKCGEKVKDEFTRDSKCEHCGLAFFVVESDRSEDYE